MDDYDEEAGPPSKLNLTTAKESVLQLGNQILTVLGAE